MIPSMVVRATPSKLPRSTSKVLTVSRREDDTMDIVVLESRYHVKDRTDALSWYKRRRMLREMVGMAEPFAKALSILSIEFRSVDVADSGR
jgi:hypothetical protein